MTDVDVPEMKKSYGGYRPKRSMTGRRKGQRLTYKWKKRPYAHQVEAVKKLLSTGFGGGLLMEPRTGKTKVAVDYASILHAAGKVNRVVVFCPVNALGVWEDEIAANCPYPYRIVVWNRKTRKKTNHALPRYGDDMLDFVIINYDALSTAGAVIPHKLETCDECGLVEYFHYHPKKADHQYVPGPIQEFNKHPVTKVINRSKRRGGRYEIKKRILRWQPQLMILDESHRIKSATARKSTAIHSLANCSEYRVIMTGTVVTKKKRLIDIWSQWRFLNPSRFNMTFTEFKFLYGRYTQRNGYERWLRNINEDKLHALIHFDSFSITREECYDLPAQTHQPILFDLEDDESGLTYDKMAAEMVARIKTGEITEASIALVLSTRLRQITSGLSKTSPSERYPKGRLVAIGSEKLRVIRSRLEDLLEEDEKVVIGAVWKGDIYRLQKMLASMKVPTFTIQGGMKHEDRERARIQFPKVSGGAVFIGQPASAGEAIDLSCASVMMWYSLTPSWVNFRQFTDRIALSDKPTFYEYYLARGTVDEMLLTTLQEDGDLGKYMITSPERLRRLAGMNDLPSEDYF